MWYTCNDVHIHFVCMFVCPFCVQGRGDIQPQLDSAMQDVSDKYILLEETEKQALRKALIEERQRFCCFVAMLRPVVVSTAGENQRNDRLRSTKRQQQKVTSLRSVLSFCFNPMGRKDAFSCHFIYFIIQLIHVYFFSRPSLKLFYITIVTLKGLLCKLFIDNIKCILPPKKICVLSLSLILLGRGDIYVGRGHPSPGHL